MKLNISINRQNMARKTQNAESVMMLMRTIETQNKIAINWHNQKINTLQVEGLRASDD